MDIYIKTKEDMEKAVKKTGILPFFANSIKGFSLEEHCSEEAFFGSEPGVWEWKGPVIMDTDCAYGKFFERKAAFISMEWYPDFCNWRRDGYDFDAAVDDGLAGSSEEFLYNIIASKYSILSKDAKIQGGYTRRRSGNDNQWEPRKGFDAAITKLQMKGYVTITNFEYEMDKKGEFYGWGIARYSIPEKHFGKRFTGSVYQRTPGESYQRIFQHLREILPEAADNEIEYFLNRK